MASITATGYVHDMLDKGMSFEQFAMNCARAFGALVLMRDDPADAPIPEELQPNTEYHDKRLIEARDLIARLEAMNDDERDAYGMAQQQDRVAMLNRSMGERSSEIAKCRAMLDRVKAWRAPTPEHVGLHTFMVEQLTNSIGSGNDFYEKELSATRLKRPRAFFDEALSAARRDIEYHTSERKKEIQRTDERNRWLRALRESLKVSA